MKLEGRYGGPYSKMTSNLVKRRDSDVDTIQTQREDHVKTQGKDDHCPPGSQGERGLRNWARRHHNPECLVSRTGRKEVSGPSATQPVVCCHGGPSRWTRRQTPAESAHVGGDPTPTLTRPFSQFHPFPCSASPVGMGLQDQAQDTIICIPWRDAAGPKPTLLLGHYPTFLHSAKPAFPRKMYLNVHWLSLAEMGPGLSASDSGP